jgi:hypothetical protein
MKLYSLQSTVYSLQSTVYSLQSTVYSLQSTVYRPIPTADSSNVLIKKSRISDIRFIKQKKESDSANSEKVRKILVKSTVIFCLHACIGNISNPKLHIQIIYNICFNNKQLLEEVEHDIKKTMPCP